MSHYKSFAVAGAGSIGFPIINALLEKGASVVILSRSTKPVPPGASLATVDYNDIPALTKTLKKHSVDVVISTFGLEGLPVQSPLADASKAAGVKLFLPSEFGAPTEGAPAGLLLEKDQFIKHLEKIELPYVRIYVGFFTSFIWWLTGISETGAVQVVGEGNTPVSWTSEADIAGFVAHITTAVSPEKVNNRAFRLQGDRATLREIAAIFGVPVVQHEGPPPALSPLQGFLLTVMGKGAASTGWDNYLQKDVGSAGEGNALWPGHHWTTIKEFHKLPIKQ